MSLFTRLLVPGLLLASSLSAAVQPWAQVKAGLSSQQAVALLGEPLFRRHGKGFETWTYDGGAEVVLFGANGVVGWTAPAAAGLPERSRDVWNSRQPGQTYTTLYSFLQENAPRPSVADAKAIADKGNANFAQQFSYEKG